MSKSFKMLLPPLMSLLMLTVLLTGLFGQPTDSHADSPTSGDTVRFATFNASLNRNAEGQLITDLMQLTNTQISAVAEIIQRVNPDVLLINEFDYNVADPHKAPQLFRDNYLAKGQNGANPVSYPYHYVASVNTGVASGMDLDNNNKVATQAGSFDYAGDAFGFGTFPGQYGMVVYSKYPIMTDSVRTFQKFLWKDMPGALLPATVSGTQTISWYSQAELDVFRLSSKSHWDVPIKIGGEVVHALVSHPTPPVFDGPEDRNGTRNHDEIRLWADYVTPDKSGYIYDDKGTKGGLTQAAKFVIMGDQNADPFDGDSTNNAIKQLLDNPVINSSNPPSSEGGVEQAQLQGGINISHTGKAAYDTGDFRDDTTPGNLRVDYVLPSLNMGLKSSGVFWPKKDDPLFKLVGTYPFPSSDHRLVYVNLDLATNQISIPAIQGNDKDSPLAGKTVKTKGIVTAVFPKGQVFIQDGYGPRTGIMAYRPKTTAPLKVGDYITLMGEVEERYGLTQFAFGAQAQVISSGNTLPPTKVLTSGAVSAENWESVLVRVENVRVSNENPDAPSNYGEWEIDDGSGGIRVDDLAKVAYKQTGDDQLDFVQGPLYYSFSNFKIVPRDNADIGYVGLTKSSLGSVAAGQIYTYTLTINNLSDKSLTNVVMTDTLPSDVAFTVASDGGTLSGNIVRWTGLTVTANSSLSVTLAVKATGQNGTIIENKDYAFKADNYNRVVKGKKVSTVIGEVTIPFVQGKGDASPLEGQNVTVSGVVIGTFQGDKALRGFFMQDPNGDGDPMTSDGIFVYAPTYKTPLTVGQKVVVTGKVQEERATTRIMATKIDLSTALSAPTINPMTVNLPFSSTTVPEQYEGMLVKMPQTLYVTELRELGEYGEMLLSANARLVQPTDVVTPGQASIDMQAANRLNQIRVDDGSTVKYPDPIVYPAPGLTYSRTVRGGDTVAGLTGVMDDNFGRYRVQPVSSVIVTSVNPRPAKPQDVGSSLKVAAFNVLNYFTSFGADQRGATNADEFARQRAKIVRAITTIDAAVVGLIEIENNGYGSDSAIQNLVNGLNEATGQTTYAFIKPDVAKIGSDQIAVGFIYQPDMVTPVGAAAILDAPSFTNPNNLEKPKNRPALAQTFKDKNGGMVTAVVNHFKSKSSKCGAGDDDKTTGQGNCNNTRTKAAQALANWLATDPTNSGDPDYLILGDLNSYAMEDPIRALETAGYTNLAKKFGANYSYVYSGQWGFLDYAMSNDPLTPQVTGATVWHVNADEPEVLDYNTEDKSAAQKSSLYGPGPYRSSDHDPVVVGLNLAPSQALGGFPNKVAAGDTTQTSTTLWARNTAAGTITFTYGTDKNLSNGTTVTASITDPLVPAKVQVSNLTPNTTYYYQAVDKMGNVETGRFNTAAEVGTKVGLTFGVSGDWRGELSPYPAIVNAIAKQLDFFVSHGDTIYADYPSPAVPLTQATTITDYRHKHSEVYSERHGMNSLADLRASTSIFATIDDHEVTNDFSGGADASTDPRFPETSGLINDTKLFDNGLQAFQEYNPIQDEFYPDAGDDRFKGERKLYRYQTFGSDAALIVLDNRSFRDAPLKAPDVNKPNDVIRYLSESFNSNRTMLGAAQLADLKADLLKAQAKGITWKFVAVPEPIQNLGIAYSEDRFEGYAAERTEILSFIKENKIDNVVFVAADIHGTVVNNLTYQQGVGQPQIPTNAFEISTGSVAFHKPFGPTVVDLAVLLNLITPTTKAIYDQLPVANDADSVINDKDDFVKSLTNRQITTVGYDPIGLNDNLTSTMGLIDAQLLQGDYIALHTYGWTEFDIEPTTQQLKVTTYGIDYYSQADMTANPDTVKTRTPKIVSQFVVTPTTSPVGEAFVKVAHFAPFTSDSGPRQGTLVDVRVNGTVIREGVRFGDVTEYITTTAGDLFVEVLQGGAPVISKTIAATAGMSYTIVADGGSNGYPLALLTLVDNTTDPMTGTGKVRIVHVAPFTSSNNATVDVINQADNSQVVSGLPYGAASPSITTYHTLPVASYDLAVVAPGTTNVLIDLDRFSLNDGEIVTIFAIGDGDNQSLRTLPEILKLGTPVELKTLLPILLKQ